MQKMIGAFAFQPCCQPLDKWSEGGNRDSALRRVGNVKLRFRSGAQLILRCRVADRPVASSSASSGRYNPANASATLRSGGKPCACMLLR